VAVGTVKWFNDEKGWGFIAVDGQPTSLCTTRRFKEKVVRRSSKVRPLRFDIEPGDRGPLAKRVVLN